ncbi:peptide-methionine (S)-S-oxide reductase MsrA [Arenibacter sp. GZD96]|uniref:peptide-methionine (S)-S-oxide reductase MsrA n=1 Tax=Aurantibrevibacter litoralis TaxID=3106030 RepID=UPI002AFFFEFF|nr:peptide-methionine (S)-S-oxide reductase MsrA [Arenibacter sp. GZD-96]MEA1785485.1 peptide-methionine (S)-S-oxide reductase MsrA [Arenibacter sp. GZD-96]
MATKISALATVGGGCFWCTEAIFQELKGIESVVSGYTGGQAPGKPTYREVCSGLTGHAEAVQLRFFPDEISYETILRVFMSTHDPTTLNRQGADVGSQYRSVIYYHNEAQKQSALDVFKEMAPFFNAPIVTELSPAVIFYEAETDHQNYYKNNASQGYCRMVISPKLAKLRKLYSNTLKGSQ